MAQEADYQNEASLATSYPSDYASGGLATCIAHYISDKAAASKKIDFVMEYSSGWFFFLSSS